MEEILLNVCLERCAENTMNFGFQSERIQIIHGIFMCKYQLFLNVFLEDKVFQYAPYTGLCTCIISCISPSGEDAIFQACGLTTEPSALVA